MPHLDIIREENTHRATPQTERLYKGGEAFLASNGDHFPHQTQRLNMIVKHAVMHYMMVLSQQIEQSREHHSMTNGTATETPESLHSVAYV